MVKKRNFLSCLKMKYLNYYRIIKKKLDDETTKVLKLAFEKKNTKNLLS